jgi:uncharacterized protein (TIGR00730 family)
MMNRICVYSGSQTGNRAEYISVAQRLGDQMIGRSIDLVYGGGNIGLMNIVAETILRQGGHVTGVIPQALVEMEVAHLGVSELLIVESMHQRKAKMAELSDAFIALPGGIGTFEELFEMLCWLQLGFHTKPVGLLNVCGYYDKLLEFLRHSVDEGFIKPEHISMLIVSDNPEELVEKLLNYKHQHIEKL